MTRFGVIGTFVLAAGSMLVTGCGDGENAIFSSVNEVGGSSANAGEAGSSGESSTTGGTAGSSSQTGGEAGTTVNQGGRSGAGGSTNAGQAGTSLVGGNAGTAGTAGGEAGTGGALVGGNAGTGGTGGSTQNACTTSIVTPYQGETLTESDDADGDFCQNGFQFTVVAGTDAAEGTAAVLSVNGNQLATTEVTNAVTRFENVQLGSSGSKTLTVRVGSGTSACTSTVDVTINCQGAPSCEISSPVITEGHPELNGVPVAQGGDRVSSTGSAYQVAFEVSTDVADGQPVWLTVDDTSTVYSAAQNGTAVFAGVTLVPDGMHSVTATCRARSGIDGSSTAQSYLVDTAAPDLAATKLTAGDVVSELQDGDHFAPGDDADPNTDGLQLGLCGSTTSEDAIDLKASPNNFCVSVGGNTPVCSAVSSLSGNGTCVNLDCPGSGPFDVTLSLKDNAGNPTTQTFNNLTCASSLPIVQFVDPVSDTDFTDPSLRILAAANPTATRKDKNASLANTQYDVKVCTSAGVGSTAVLRAGRVGSSLNQVGTGSVVADTGETVCSGSQPNYVVFSNVTIPDSLLDSEMNLTATRLQADVTDVNLATGTATADVWADSTMPTLTLVLPAGFCGSYISDTNPVNQTLIIGSPIASVDYPVTVVVTNPDGSDPAANTYYGTSLNFQSRTNVNVTLQVGHSVLNATVEEPSSNVGIMTACPVDVGPPPPTVEWVAPTASSKLNASNDADTGTAGWQGTLQVHTSLTGADAAGRTVVFKANGVQIGSAVNIDSGTGDATTPSSVTVPEGNAVQLTATTAGGTGAEGSASITVPVDVTVPSAPTGLSAAVVPAKRRQTTFLLSWTAPADGTQNAAGYDIKVSKSAIDDSNFDAAETVTYSGTPAAAGQGDSIEVPDLYIENNYYFALRAFDAAGNKGPIAATTDPAIEHFAVTELADPTPATAHNFGWVVDGSSDFNGDGYADLYIGEFDGTHAYIYLSTHSGYTTSPNITITDSGAVSQFGSTRASVGDVNKDGVDDLCIGAPRKADGMAFVYYGHKYNAATDPWDSQHTYTLTELDADVTIHADRSADALYAGSTLGTSIAAVGDFDGDMVDDFAIGVPNFNYAAYQGQVVIVFGKEGGLSSDLNIPGAFDTGEAMHIDGNIALEGNFGQTLIGLGYSYGGTATTTLVVASPYDNSSGGLAFAGRLYAFAGSEGITGGVAASSALSTLDGAAAYENFGFYDFVHMGDLGPGGQPALSVGIPNYLAPGRALLSTGSSDNGPLTSQQYLKTSETGSAYRFGTLTLGGGRPGANSSMSFIGTADRSDVIVSTRTNSNPRIYIIDGSKLSIAGGETTVNALADVTLAMPTGFVDFGHIATSIQDLDKDTYGDFAVGDVSYTATIISGRVIVYH